mmetsp:Transcript_73174/g.176566  ORF Transcript_73174/g.176566 Transcript_73174/m.176566 type:complete len:225 (-) Transcript_73174:298-972(-)
MSRSGASRGPLATPPPPRYASTPRCATSCSPIGTPSSTTRAPAACPRCARCGSSSQTTRGRGPWRSSTWWAPRYSSCPSPRAARPRSAPTCPPAAGTMSTTARPSTGRRTARWPRLSLRCLCSSGAGRCCPGRCASAARRHRCSTIRTRSWSHPMPRAPRRGNCIWMRATATATAMLTATSFAASASLRARWPTAPRTRGRAGSPPTRSSGSRCSVPPSHRASP